MPDHQILAEPADGDARLSCPRCQAAAVVRRGELETLNGFLRRHLAC